MTWMLCADSLRTQRQPRGANRSERAQARRKQMNTPRELLKDQSGASATEYGLMIALIVLVSLLAVVFIGRQTRGTIEKVHEAVHDVNH
jgi:Flp pilus assembly pilin Flp